MFPPVYWESSVPPCLKTTCGAPDIQTFPRWADFGPLALHCNCLGLHAFYIFNRLPGINNTRIRPYRQPGWYRG